MSCDNCNCLDCNRQRGIDKAMNRSNDMDDSLNKRVNSFCDKVEEFLNAPIHQPTWKDAEPANEVQAKRWGEIINETLDTHKSINMYATIIIVLTRCHVRNENYERVGLQVERFIRESPAFEIRKGKNGGVFRSATPTLAIESVQGESPRSKAQRIVDHIKAKEKEALSYIELGTMHGVPDLITGKLADDYTCGCGNTKCNKTEKSCWKCGAPIKV